MGCTWDTALGYSVVIQSFLPEFLSAREAGENWDNSLFPCFQRLF